MDRVTLALIGILATWLTIKQRKIFVGFYTSWELTGVLDAILKLFLHFLLTIIVTGVFVLGAIFCFNKIVSWYKGKKKIKVALRPLITDCEKEWEVITTELLNWLISSDDDCKKSALIEGHWGTGKSTYLDYFMSLFYATKLTVIETTNYELKETGFTPSDLEKVSEDTLKAFNLLHKDSNWAIVQFNPWQLHTENDPVESFIEELSKHPTSQRLQINGILKRLLLATRESELGVWSNILITLCVPSVASVIETLNKSLNHDKFIIVIDDLERCPPEYIERIFRLISLLRPLHSKLRFIVAGNYELIEHQLRIQLNLPLTKENEFFNNESFLEKIFDTFHLPYFKELIAKYLINFHVKADKGTVSIHNRASVPPSDLHRECIVPFFSAFGILNRRDCQLFCKIFLKDRHIFLKRLEHDPESPKTSATFFSWLKVIERVLISLSLIKFKHSDIFSRIREHKDDFVKIAGNESPPDETALKDDQRKVWQGIDLEGRKYIANTLHLLSKKVDPEDQHPGSQARMTAKLEQLIRLTSGIRNNYYD